MSHYGGYGTDMAYVDATPLDATLDNTPLAIRCAILFTFIKSHAMAI